MYLTAYAVVNVASQMWSNSVRKLQNNFDLCPACIYCYSYWHFVFTILAECWTKAQNVVAQTLNQTCPFAHLSWVSSYLNVFWWFSGKGAVWTHMESSWGVFMLSFCEIKSQYVINIHWLIETCANLDKIQVLSPNHSLYNYNEFEIQYLVSSP